ncbi:17608_t:CDS:2 [Acaulospora morrowiae]|uniref:Cytochrome c oxidase assembly protein COX16, mitochondrial n=1 Tax=Acaulospora morrowiae TaxID=94023 RepID=A0A9N8WAF2_9GLOM|nr:17608_t:CDS:2 [Acaulospora morrowiae]
MPQFLRKPFYKPPAHQVIRKHSFVLFGLPLILAVVSGSFALSYLTQTRYDVHENKVKKVSKEEQLKINKGRRKVNLQEEYWKLQEIGKQDWESKRVERPEGAFNVNSEASNDELTRASSGESVGPSSVNEVEAEQIGLNENALLTVVAVVAVIILVTLTVAWCDADAEEGDQKGEGIRTVTDKDDNFIQTNITKFVF